MMSAANEAGSDIRLPVPRLSLARVRGKGWEGGLFFGSSSSPRPSCPCYSEVLERKYRIPDAIHRNHNETRQVTDALEKWETTQCTDRWDLHLSPPTPTPGQEEDGGPRVRWGTGVGSWGAGHRS